MGPSLVLTLALALLPLATQAAPDSMPASPATAGPQVGAGAGAGKENDLDWEPEWEPAEEWRRLGDLQLRHRLDRLAKPRRTAGVARNVVLVVGDGMGLATTTAAGILRGGEGHLLAWERFPTVGLAKTYSVDHQVPDSAATATAMLSGSKTRSRMLGLDARANKTTCDASMNAAAALSTMATWAQQAGRAAGLVTTARVTHATPAAVYARSNHRDWECDAQVPAESRGCVADIARQLVSESPGKDLHVVLGGGRRQLGASGTEDPDPEDNSCVRADKRNLTQEWLALPGRREYVSTAAQLLEPGLPRRADYLMGLFAAGHMAFDAERTAEQPSLADMTRVAVRTLRRRNAGYFLLVEGARVDMAHHKNWARLALLDALALENAVNAILDEVDLGDTLVIVTADHSHAMTINGYPERGSDILDIAYPEEGKLKDNVEKYETITYANGPGYKDHEGKNIVDIPAAQRQQLRYRHQAGIYTKDETHAGEDVPVYATGAGSELFAGVYEQSYIATAMAYAAGVDRYANERDVTGTAAASAPTACSLATVAGAIALLAAGRGG